MTCEARSVGSGLAGNSCWQGTMLPVRERHQRGAVQPAEFAISIVELGFDRGLADAETARDMRVGEALSHQKGNLQFGLGEKRPDLLAFIGPFGFPPRGMVHEPRRKTALSTRNRGQTFRHAIERRLLGDNPPRPLSDSCGDFLLRGCEEHHPRPQPFILNKLQELDAAEFGKRHPEHRNTRPELPNTLQRGYPIHMRFDDVEARELAKQGAEPMQINGLIIGEQNADPADLGAPVIAAVARAVEAPIATSVRKP